MRMGKQTCSSKRCRMESCYWYLSLRSMQVVDKGNRPSFTQAGNPQKAEQLYEYIIGECKKEIDIVQTGVFGAHMEVSLINDGPFTVVLEDL